MYNLRTILLTIVAVVLTVVFLVWGYGATRSGTNSAQVGILQGAQALIGASPNAVQTTVNNGVPSTTTAPSTITGVTWNTSTWSPSLTIDGYNLGTSGALSITDNTTGWLAASGGVAPAVSARSNLAVQVSGLSGYGGGDVNTWADGQGSWSFRPNDQLTIQVTNNQLGETTAFNTAYPATAPMPTITMTPNPLPTMTTDGTVNLSGKVAFNGTPLANQAVALTATGGSFSSSSGQYVKDNPNVFMTFTDANGNWSATYTAPTAAGNYTITASTAGQSVSESTAASDPAPAVTWSYPSGQTFTVAQAQATGCGQGVVWSFTPPSYGGYSGWSQGWDAPTPQLQFTSTSGCLSPNGLSVGTHRVVLIFFFANGQTAQATSQPITITANPSVSINATTHLHSGASETITGTVTVGGSPDANVKVALSAPSGDGTFSSATVTTNGSGDFSDTYTAPGTSETFTLSATSGGITGSAPITVEPLQIARVTWNTSTWPPSMTVAGNGFGSSGILEVIENAQGQGAAWDNNPSTPDNNLQVSSWSDTGISAGDFASYGATNGFYFAPGEAVGIMVTNGQTGQSASYSTTYPANAPMPTVTLNPVADINTGQLTTITGNVNFGGAGLANQQVNLTASGGSLGASSVQTDGSGNFSVTYTAPSAGGTYTVTAASDTGHATANVTVNNPPQITGVTFNTGAWAPQLTITGANFGASAGNVELLDHTQSAWWDNAGTTGGAMAPANTGADSVNASWSNTSIGLSNFNGYGQNVGWHDYLAPGDAITVYVENTQTGQTTSYNTTYPSSAPMPAVALNSIASVQTGQSTTVSGTVTWQGQALNNALVTLSATGGSLGNATVTTNSSGQFSATYTAPSTAGTYTITASSFTSSTSTNVKVTVPPPIITGVTWNTGTAAHPIWPPQVTINGSGFGSASSNGYVQLVDSTRGWQGATSGSTVVFTVPTWANNQIIISGMSNYGQVVVNGTNYGGNVFAPSDSVTVNVTNPQTGQTASLATSVPANMPVPVVTADVSQYWVNPGQSVQVTGTVTFGGQPVANQPITLGAYAGDINGSYPGGPPATVDTNSTGNFVATFTASGNSSPSAHQEGGGVDYGGANAGFAVMVRP